MRDVCGWRSSKTVDGACYCGAEQLVTNRRSGTAETGWAAQGMRRRPALITRVRRGQEDTRHGVEDARVDNLIIINIV